MRTREGAGTESRLESERDVLCVHPSLRTWIAAALASHGRGVSPEGDEWVNGESTVAHDVASLPSTLVACSKHAVLTSPHVGGDSPRVLSA